MREKEANKIAALKKKVEEFKGQPTDDNIGYREATSFKIIADIASGIAVGCFLGYILDQYFGTLPLFMFVLIICGTIGGLYNVYKDAVKSQKKE